MIFSVVYPMIYPHFFIVFKRQLEPPPPPPRMCKLHDITSTIHFTMSAPALGSKACNGRNCVYDRRCIA